MIQVISLFLGVKKAVTLVLVFQLLLGLLIFYTYKITDWTVIRPALAALLVGSVIGTLSLAYLDDNTLRLVLALAVLLYLGKQVLFRDKRFGTQRPKIFGAVGGGLGGWFQGVIGTGAPPLVIYLNEMDLQKAVFRACMIMMLFVCNLTRLVTSISTDLFTSDMLKDALYTLPVFLCALYAGHRTHFKVSQRVYEIGIHSVLLLSSVLFTLQVRHDPLSDQQHNNRMHQISAATVPGNL